MFNTSGITSTVYTAPKQILADVKMQCSVGCIVPQSMGVTVDTTKKIVKAGTPIQIAMANPQTPAVAANGTTAMNAVLLHDVDVTAGAANGTALIFGFVNTKRVDSDVATLITTALGASGASKLLTFMSV